MGVARHVRLERDVRRHAVQLSLVSRRRELGATSARSLLLTVLGEFVLPRPEPVWTQTLIDVLSELGVEQKSARQALARTAAEGLLGSDRSGRRVRWSLSASGRQLLTEGASRIYAFGDEWVTFSNMWKQDGTPSNQQKDMYNPCYVPASGTAAEFFQSVATLYQTKQFWYNAINWVAPPNECFTIKDPDVITVVK